ncbi:MAG: tetratricopeptide repeat protein [Bryobacteraceae bacterium]|nr:tetratricopeptide repeat protein [Bryobacteraceae bacterium]
MKPTILCLLAALTLPLAAQKKSADVCTPPPSRVAPALPAKLLHGQGTENIRFPITTRSKEAQRFFLQGVAQMHSFWSVEAERSFLQAAALDPEAPMPHWGIAMVATGDYRPRFQLEGYTGLVRNDLAPRVEEAVRKAHKLSAKATDLERLYIAAIAARRNPLSKNPDLDYVNGLRAIVARYPNEIEARTYLALHLMRGFELPGKTPREGSMEAADLLRQLMKDAPNHPGVHHYVIHGFEGSTFASDAWESCRRYAELAPNIPHALHMPGHIYSQTGRWDDAVRSFSSAAENEIKWIQADPFYTSGHHGHNVHYMATAFSFEGKYEEAIQAARSLLAFKENPREEAQIDNARTAFRQGWFALMRTLVQHERWTEILDGASLPVVDKPRELAWRHWASGLAHAARGDAGEAQDSLDAMDEVLDQYQDKVKQAVPAELRVARQELTGHILIARKKVEQGIEKLRKTMKRERALIYSEPPFYPRPVGEALGRISLRHGDTDSASKAFREALEQFPDSAIAKSGLRDLEGRAGASGAGQ